MKVGAQDKKKVIIMAVLLAIAIPLLIYSFGSVSGSTPAPAPATTTPPQPGPSVIPVSQKKAGITPVRENTLDPTLRTDILAASQKIEYKGGDRNIFRMREVQVPIPAPAGNPRTVPTPIPQPTYVEALKPPIPLKYYGFSDRPGEAKQAFLQDGDSLFVAVEGQIVERRYKIVKITNNFVMVEDVLNNNTQNINMTPRQTTG